MQRIAQKLKSTRGASLIFALLVFALCALAGTVVLVAAAANIGRYTHLVREEQQYLSAASALDVLQGRLDDPDKQVKVKVEYTETETWYYTGDEGSRTLERDTTYALKRLDPKTDAVLTDPAGYLETLLLRRYVPAEWYTGRMLVPDSFTVPTVDPTWTAGAGDTYTVTLEPKAGGALPEDWADTLYPVTVTVKPLNTDAPVPGDLSAFTLEMTLAAKTGKGDSVHPLKVVWTAEVDTDTETSTTTTGSVPADPSVAGGADSSGTRTTTTTLTVTLRWSADNRTVTFG